jgi:hypothetical protein
VQEDAQLTVADEVLVVVELGIGHAHALDLAALDRQRRITNALVALDNAELGAEIISRVNRSSTVLTGEVCQLTQIRLGSE